MDASCIGALLKHGTSLKEVTLNEFSGDAGSVLCGWPQSVPNLSIFVGSGYIPSNSIWITPSTTGPSPGTLSIFNGSNFGLKAMGIYLPMLMI